MWMADICFLNVQGRNQFPQEVSMCRTDNKQHCACLQGALSFLSHQTIHNKHLSIKYLGIKCLEMVNVLTNISPISSNILKKKNICQMLAKCLCQNLSRCLATIMYGKTLSNVYLKWLAQTFTKYFKKMLEVTWNQIFAKDCQTFYTFDWYMCPCYQMFWKC